MMHSKRSSNTFLRRSRTEQDLHKFTPPDPNTNRLAETFVVVTGSKLSIYPTPGIVISCSELISEVMKRNYTLRLILLQTVTLKVFQID